MIIKKKRSTTFLKSYINLTLTVSISFYADEYFIHILTAGFSNFFLATLSKLLWMPVIDLPRMVLSWSTIETVCPVDAATYHN